VHAGVVGVRYVSVRKSDSVRWRAAHHVIVSTSIGVVDGPETHCDKQSRNWVEGRRGVHRVDGRSGPVIIAVYPLPGNPVPQ